MKSKHLVQLALIPQIRRALTPGATFVDPTYGTRIELTAIDDSYAHLVIDASAVLAALR